MENVKYRFKEYSRVSSFVNSSDTNMKIYRELNGKDFFLKEGYASGEYRAMDIHGERIGSGRRYDFTEMEVSTYLEIVGETKDSLDCTISYHDWAVRHALTNLPVEKVVAMYKIFTQ